MSPTPIRVLAVEDNPGDLRLVSEILGESTLPRFEITPAGTVGEALTLLRERRPDVVLLDLNLPDSRGLEGLDAIAGRAPEIPVIVLTGLEDEETGFVAIQRRASDFLVKGQIEGHLLIRSIRYAIERKASEREIRRLNQDLKRRVEELQTIFDTVPIGISISEDPEGRHIRGNPAIERLLGLPRDGELSLRAAPASRTPFRLLRDDHEMAVDQLPMQRAVRGERVEGLQVVAALADGQRRDLIVNAETLFDEEGTPRGAVGAFQDVTDLKRAEAALRESERNLRHANELIEAVTRGTEVIIAAVDRDFRFVFFNESYREEIRRLTGKEIAIGAPMLDLFDPMSELREVVVAEWGRALAGESTNRTLEFGDPGRHRRTYSVLHTPIRGAEGEVLGAGEVAYDITERVRVEEALRRSEATLQGILDATQESIWLFDPEGRALLANATALARLRMPFDRVIGKTFEEILSPDLAASRREKLRETLESGRPVDFEDARAGLSFHHTFYPVLGPGGEVTAVTSFSRDITARKEAEERLRASLAEKEVLLKEVHHRVKNNLQVIASMLDLQMESIRHEADRAPLLESQSRVQTLALIHEKLYGSADLSRIPFREYAGDLARYLLRTYQSAAGTPALELDIEDVHLAVGEAIPLGLILNEVLCNSLKHAFPAGREGRIRVGFRGTGEGRFQLSMADDGVGMPEDLDPLRTKTLGLQLVGVLVKQLGGTLEIHRDGGTRFDVAFREEP